MQRVPLGPDMDEALAALVKTMKWGKNPNSAAVTFGPQSTFFKGKDVMRMIDEIIAYANDFMLTGEGAKRLAKMGRLESYDDPRIRELIPQEINPIRKYITVMDGLHITELVCRMNFLV